MDLEKVNVYYSIDNGGDGSASPSWWLTADDASRQQEMAYEGFAEDCSGCVETYVGSNIHQEALRNAKEHTAKMRAKAAGRHDWEWNFSDLMD